MISYSKFYHTIIQPTVQILVIDWDMTELYKGKAGMIYDDVWEAIKDRNVFSAGMTSTSTELVIMLEQPKKPKTLAEIKKGSF